MDLSNAGALLGISSLAKMSAFIFVPAAICQAIWIIYKLTGKPEDESLEDTLLINYERMVKSYNRCVRPFLC